jgi:NitT/TauT family transport system permease protein
MKWLLDRPVIPPLLLLLAVLFAWHAAVVVFDIPPYLLPGPAEVARGVWHRAGPLAAAAGITGAGAACGFAASLVLGTGIALLFSQAAVIRRSCYPYAIFLQTMPIVAIAPLIVTWFGSGFHSVVMIACMISLFPVITNVTTGLITVDPGLRDLFRLHRASRAQLLGKLQIPNAVPYLVTGAKTSSGLAVVGAIVGEFFVGYGTTHHGLGFIILYAGPQLKTDQLFAATIASALLGIAMFGATTLMGKAVLGRWHETPLN